MEIPSQISVEINNNNVRLPKTFQDEGRNVSGGLKSGRK
jgi:hypothetical protein